MTRLIAKFLGNPTFLAAATILGPFPRNIQAHIHQCVFAPRDVAHEDSHLAILDLSQTSTPLPRRRPPNAGPSWETPTGQNDHTIRSASSVPTWYASSSSKG